ncbi:MAG: hypothetical protein EA412_02570 [Chitinophagaceae bacterium]|nr:MAG: hypothetical protein EA412_02570 [Chitinophagaceae bacterium]
MKKILIYIVLIPLFGLFSCSKKEVLDEVPYIELVSVEPLEMIQFKDTLTITIRYEDGNGDLGFADADSNALYVHDQRLDKADMFYVPPLAPLDAEVHISGKLDIQIGNTFLIGNGPSEKTRFYIKIRDRAGNMSNEIVTPEITILRE